MRRLVSIAALFLSFGLGFASLTVAQSEDLSASSRRDHEHGTMAAHQAVVRGQARELGACELRAATGRGSLEDAATHYHEFQSDMWGHRRPDPTISAAIEAKDSVRFIKGYNALTAACNACHEGFGRGFIVIQVPTASPFSDRSFARPSLRSDSLVWRWSRSLCRSAGSSVGYWLDRSGAIGAMLGGRGGAISSVLRGPPVDRAPLSRRECLRLGEIKCS